MAGWRMTDMALFPLLWREQVRLCKKAICFLLHSPLKEMMPIVTKNTEHGTTTEAEDLIIELTMHLFQIDQ